MCEYEPLTDEELWGVPVDEQPNPDPERNYFDESQAIGKRQPEPDPVEDILPQSTRGTQRKDI